LKLFALEFRNELAVDQEVEIEINLELKLVFVSKSKITLQ